MAASRIIHTNEPSAYNGPGWYFWLRLTGKHYGPFNTRAAAEEAEREAIDMMHPNEMEDKG